METKGYYATVGFFVIALSAIGLIIALWLSVGINTKSYDHYLIYMKESVAGLTISAPVKYNGVDVGFVKKISLNRADPHQVEIVVSVYANTPINAATRATLNMQGVTGIAYIELRAGADNAPALTAKPGQRYPVIATSPSLLFRMDAAVARLSENVQAITGSVKMVFSKKNGQLLQDTLSNIESVSRNLKDNNEALTRIVKNADVFFDNASVSSEKLPSLMDSAQNTLKNLDQLAVQLNNTANTVQLTLKQSDAMIQTVNNETLPTLMNLMVDVNGVTLRLDDFTQELADNPSMLIRGKSPAPLGPGETRGTVKARN